MADNRIKQSAVIPYHWRKESVQIILVTFLETGRWVLPKGNIERGLTAHDSAAREGFEEAGVEGLVGTQDVGAYQYEKIDKNEMKSCDVAVFPLAVRHVRKDWPEKALRRRKWMSLDQAIAAVNEKKLKKILAKFGKDVARSS